LQRVIAACVRDRQELVSRRLSAQDAAAIPGRYSRQLQLRSINSRQGFSPRKFKHRLLKPVRSAEVA